MPQWAGSCWYYLRYIDPQNDQAALGPGEGTVLDARRPLRRRRRARGAAPALQPVLAQGALRPRAGQHARAVPEAGEPGDDPGRDGVHRLSGRVEPVGLERDVEQVDHGISIKGIARRQPMPAVKLAEDQVVKKGRGFVLADRPEIRVDARAHKMSKSRGNVINPDAIVAEYGADSLRLYEMFMGPLEAVKPWSMKGVEGVYRFLARAWRMIVDAEAETGAARPAGPGRRADSRSRPRSSPRTVAAVTDDLEAMRFNTAISRLMEFVNVFTGQEVRPKAAMETFTLLLAPMAPHIAEELWQILGHGRPWPTSPGRNSILLS